MATRIVTHRGLDPSRPGFFTESSKEAFEDQLIRGFGLEFDLRLTKDNGFVILHDPDLTRLSRGKDTRKIREMLLSDLLLMDFNGSHLIDLPKLLDLLDALQAKDAMSAVHLKHDSQTPGTLDLILEIFRSANPSRCIIFDATIEAAHYLKSRNPLFHLAPSVAHPYDVIRYNAAVGGTLYTPEQILEHRNLFDWVWLDEWDLADKDGGMKHLYTQATFDSFRDRGFSIGLVSPELHANSPGLLGGEAHPDARNLAILTESIKQIAILHPDIICTDYPDMVRLLVAEVQ